MTFTGHWRAGCTGFSLNSINPLGMFVNGVYFIEILRHVDLVNYSH